MTFRVWSPDGQKVAFDGNGDLYVMNADGSGLRRLTRNPACDRGPAWSPDGRKIAFGGNGHIFVINVDGSGSGN